MQLPFHKEELLRKTLRPRQSHLPAPPARSGTEPSELTGHRFPHGDISRAQFHLPPCSPSTSEPRAEGRALMATKGQLSQQLLLGLQAPPDALGGHEQERTTCKRL